MMALAIVVLSVELFVCCLAGLATTYAWIAWFILVVMIICTVASAILLPINIKGIKGPNRGKSIAGTAVSGSGLMVGSIFLISFLAAIVPYLK